MVEVTGPREQQLGTSLERTDATSFSIELIRCLLHFKFERLIEIQLDCRVIQYRSWVAYGWCGRCAGRLQRGIPSCVVEGRRVPLGSRTAAAPRLFGVDRQTARCRRQLHPHINLPVERYARSGSRSLYSLRQDFAHPFFFSPF